jgi:hypothetical protein
MKVLNLQCGLRHTFEGWFASEDDFQGQMGRGLVECPLCGDKGITKMLTAPRLNLGSARSDPAALSTVGAPGVTDQVPEPTSENLQAVWINLVRHVMSNTEDVGKRFAEEARKIHYGESQERAIRGQASRQETADLLEEGISVVPLPLPSGLTGPTH